jgi:addiction module HigA family antidote
MSNMHNPAHPGEVLREYLPEGVSIGEVAKRLGVTRQALSALLNGRAGVSASMALRLEERRDQRRDVAQHADKPRPLASAQTPMSSADVRIAYGA